MCYNCSMKDDKTQKKTSKKIKAAGAAAAALIAASAATAEAFDSIDDIARSAAVIPPRAETVQMAEGNAGSDRADGEDAAAEKEKGLRAMIRRRILSLPGSLRTVVGTPLYALGCIVLQLADLLWLHLLSPIAGTVLKYIILASVIFAAAAVVLKLLYPEIKLRELFNAKNIAGILAATAVIFGLENVLDIVWPGHMPLTRLLLYSCGLVICTALLSLILKKAERIHKEKKFRSEDPGPQILIPSS